MKRGRECSIDLFLEIVGEVEEALKGAPQGWEKFDYFEDPSRLQQMTSSYPSFDPAWFFMAKNLEKAGRLDESRQALNRFRLLNPTVNQCGE